MAFDITKACQDRMNIITNMRCLVDKADAENRTANAEEQEQYVRMRDAEEALKDRIDKEEELKAKEASLHRIRNNRPMAPILGDVTGADDQQLRRLQRMGFLNFIREPVSDKRSMTLGIPEYMDLQKRALSAGINAQGGYTVPTDFIADLIKDVDDSTYVLGDARVFQLRGSGEVDFPELNTRMGALQWGSETGAATADTTADFGRRALKPRHNKLRIAVSRTLLRQSDLDIDAFVRAEMAYQFSIGLEQAFLTGVGGDRPLGFMVNSALGVSTARNVSTGNTTTAIGADNLREVKYSIKGNYWPNLKWYGHRDWVRRVSILKDGNAQYLWTPGVREGDPDMLLGHPIRMTEYAPNTFTTGLIVAALADLSRYYVLVDLNMEIVPSEHTLLATNQVEYFLFGALDAGPTREEAFALSVLT